MADKEKYMIKIQGDLIEVSEDVYYAYFHMERQERAQEEKQQRNDVFSYDALDDGEYEGRAAFCVLSYRIIHDLCRVHVVLHGCVGLDDLVEIARQYSAEIEYSDENVEALLDALFEE